MMEKRHCELCGEKVGVVSFEDWIHLYHKICTPCAFGRGEPLAFHKRALDEGCLAREESGGLAFNPYRDGTWLHKSWTAGWCDMDMQMMQPEQELEHENP